MLVRNRLHVPRAIFHDPGSPVLIAIKTWLRPSAPYAHKAVYVLNHAKQKTPFGVCFARLMGADPTTSRVTGECSTVELQPQLVDTITNFSLFDNRVSTGGICHRYFARRHSQNSATPARCFVLGNKTYSAFRTPHTRHAGVSFHLHRCRRVGSNHRPWLYECHALTN